MGSSFLSVVSSITTVALIVIATRWVFRAKGSPFPRAHDGTSVYGIKWQWRAIGLAGAVFGVVVSIWSWHDMHRPDRVAIALTVAFVTIGVWLSSGSVSTNSAGITKKVLGRSRSFQWGDITEIRLHRKDGGAIELRAGSQKLVIDSRFIASQHLLAEMEDHTRLQPTRASS
jgi:hypothetical protein